MADASLRAWVIVYVKGFCMGTADAVPGVSGGTIALIVGIYERLVTAVAAIGPETIEPLGRIHTPDGRTAFRDVLVEMDAPFLIVLGAGIMTAVITVLRVVDTAVEAYPAHTFAFFFGLIAASVVVLRGMVSFDTRGRIGAGALGFLLALVVAGEVAASGLHSPPILFLAGMVAIPAMILPGISGSLVLVIIGQYDYMAGALSAFVDALAGLAVGGELSAVVEPGIDVTAFMAGAVVGLLSVARAVKWALKSYRAATLTFLVALMAGGLRAPGDRIVRDLPATTEGLVGVVIAGLVGALLVLAVDRLTEDFVADSSTKGEPVSAADR